MVSSAIQLRSISFVDEGVDQVLDFLGDQVGVNALFIATQAFDRGVAGRQVTRKDHPGHGGDHLADIHTGGSFVRQHDEYYAATVLGPYRAKDAEVASFDALGDVMPAAKSRGMQVYSFMLENTHSGLTRDLPGWSNVLQVDAWGRSDPYACLRNPDYVAWWLGLTEDQVKTYRPDGIMIGSERNGPLDNALSEGGFARDGNAYSFCVHCLRARVRRRGSTPAGPGRGYLELDRLLRGDTPTDVDSAFIQFLRLLGEYPELIAWDRLWHEGYELFMGRMYGAIKFTAPQTAGRLARLAPQRVLALVPQPGGLQPLGAILRLREARALQQLRRLPTAPLRVDTGGAGVPRGAAADRVRPDPRRDGLRRERGVRRLARARPLARLRGRARRRRTIAAMGGKVPVYPGLDVNVPAGEGSRYTGPDDIRASVAATLDAGAPGFVLSRKYSEMTIENLEAVGDLMKERGLRW